MPSETVLVAPGRPDASSKSFATGTFLFTLHYERTTIEAATVLMARPGRQPPISASLLPLVPVRVTGSVQNSRCRVTFSPKRIAPEEGAGHSSWVTLCTPGAGAP